MVRLKKLHEMLFAGSNSKKIKLDAWFIKKACVLVKKKISRKQWPRNRNFVLLMRAVLGVEVDEDYPGLNILVQKLFIFC